MVEIQTTFGGVFTPTMGRVYHSWVNINPPQEECVQPISAHSPYWFLKETRLRSRPAAIFVKTDFPAMRALRHRHGFLGRVPFEWVGLTGIRPIRLGTHHPGAPGVQTTIKTKGVNMFSPIINKTSAIIQIRSIILLMEVEQGSLWESHSLPASNQAWT